MLSHPCFSAIFMYFCLWRYTKQINLDGTSSLSVYKKVDTPITTNSNIPSDDFVSKGGFSERMMRVRKEKRGY